jgi:hypothetical protein
MVSEAFLNSSGVVSGIVVGLVDLTGNYFSSMLLIVFFLLILCIALQLPLEVSAIFVLPFLITCYAFIPNFTAVLGVFLIYAGIILAKNFFIK